MNTPLSLMKTSLTSLSFAAFFLLAACASPAFAQDTTVWNPQLAADRQAATTIAVRSECVGTHEFELSADAGMGWFSFVEVPRLRVAPGETREVAARINTTGLDLGVYEGLILMRCVDCGVPPSCTPRNITARLKVVWEAGELERLDPEQFLARQLLAVLRPAAAGELERTVLAFETRHRLRRLKLFTLSSIGRVVVLFELLGPQDSVALAVARLQGEPDVLYSQPNFRYQTEAHAPRADDGYNDPLSGLQYGPRHIRAERLHKVSTGRGVRVALVDTGVDYNHAELKGRVVDRVNFVEDDRSFAEDVHGTLVAGVIAARPNNRIGIYGVAPGVQLIAIKAFRPRRRDAAEADGSTAPLIQGLDYALTRGARVVNLSVGGPRGPRDPSLSRLARAAHASGVVLVAAAGNGGPRGQPRFPAVLETVLAVTATDSRDELYRAATAGDYIDLAAPGVEIISTLPGDRFNAFSGTSMAAPHVSALVALLLQANPRLSPAEIKRVLEGTARDLGPGGRDARFGSGAVDACRAFERATGGKKVC